MKPLIINIRGTNGSGKSTLARGFLPEDPETRQKREVELVAYHSPTKKDPHRFLSTIGYVCGHLTRGGEDVMQVGVVGPYRTACGGMDQMPSFEICRHSIRYMVEEPMQLSTVICEGLLASGIWQSWADFDEVVKPVADFAWVYCRTPLEECLRRVYERQTKSGKERPIKEELVADKLAGVESTRRKAIAAGRLVYDLPYGAEAEALKAIVERRGEEFRARA